VIRKKRALTIVRIMVLQFALVRGQFIRIMMFTVASSLVMTMIAPTTHAFQLFQARPGIARISLSQPPPPPLPHLTTTSTALSFSMAQRSGPQFGVFAIPDPDETIVQAPSHLPEQGADGVYRIINGNQHQ
jgi:hypothetical protein